MSFFFCVVGREKGRVGVFFFFFFFFLSMGKILMRGFEGCGGFCCY